MVVKVSTRATPEPHLLARARHPHIVEVLRHAATDDGEMTLVVMPFLGGATLAEVLTERRRRGGRARWLADLDRVAAPEYRAAGADGPARELIANLTHARAAAWLIARLAEALEHAQARGVAHGDLKPSNVLLAADARPLLLDFNLATDWHDPGGRGAVELGGTLAYMAPERLRALAEPGTAPPPAPAQCHRADLYALGLILAETLGAVTPDDLAPRGGNLRDLAAALARERGEGGAFAARVVRACPAGLRPVLARCLAADPSTRYARAAELADDLDRYRDDRPFVHAPQPPWPARIARRLRRRRRTVAIVGLVLLAMLATALSLHRRHVAAQRELAQARLNSLWSGAEPGVFRFLSSPFDGTSTPAGSPATPLRLLASYDVLGSADWHARADVAALPEHQRQELDAWLQEQAWRYAAAIDAQPDAPADDLARALTILGQAASGRLPAPLAGLTRRLEAKLGRETSTVADLSGEAWIVAYLEGVAAETAGRFDQAANHYDAALTLRPEAFWAHYRAGVVAARRGDYRTAAAHLERCLVQRPDHWVLTVLLAGLCVRQGDAARADELVDRALRFGLELDEVYRSRAYVRRSLGQSDGVRGAFDRYASLVRQEGSRSRWRDWLDARALYGPEASRRPGRAIDRLRVEADDDLDAHLFLACCLRDTGRTDEALAEFDRLLARAPEHLTARFIRAVLLSKLRRPGAAAAVADVFHDPRFGDLLAAYAGQEGFDEAARLGRHAAAAALGRGDPDGAMLCVRRGAGLLDRLKARRDRPLLERLRAEYHFSAARIHAARVAFDPTYRSAAVAELEAAAETLGEEAWSWYTTDPAFEPIRPVRREQEAPAPDDPI